MKDGKTNNESDKKDSAIAKIWAFFSPTLFSPEHKEGVVKYMADQLQEVKDADKVMKILEENNALLLKSNDEFFLHFSTSEAYNLFLKNFEEYLHKIGKAPQNSENEIENLPSLIFEVCSKVSTLDGSTCKAFFIIGLLTTPENSKVVDAYSTTASEDISAGKAELTAFPKRDVVREIGYSVMRVFDKEGNLIFGMADARRPSPFGALAELLRNIDGFEVVIIGPM